MIVKQPNKKFVPPKNLNGLQVGQEFKTLTELGNFLGIKLPSNRTGSPCLDVWKKYFNWEKANPTSHRIVITDIYVDTIANVEDGQKTLQLNTLTKSRQEVQSFLIKRLLNLLQENDGELIIGKRELIQQLDMANENLWDNKAMNSFSSINSTSMKLVMDFHEIVQDDISSKLSILIRDLKNRKYITCTKDLLVKAVSDSTYRTPTETESNVIKSTVRKHTQSTSLQYIGCNIREHIRQALLSEYEESYSVAEVYVIKYIGAPSLSEYPQVTKRERNNFNKLLREKFRDKYKSKEPLVVEGLEFKRSLKTYEKMSTFFIKNY